MNRHLSPKDLALVIGVSESSVKRWVDEGRLIASRTAGGHRRIVMHEAIRFIRDTHQTIVRPDMLGLTDLPSVIQDGAALHPGNTGADEAALCRALESGNAEAARGLIMAQYLSARSFATVCDAGIAHAMHRIGELWRHSDSGIVAEHRATEIVVDSIHHVRATLPPAPDDAPLALGATASGDPTVLSSLMAATTLLECGYRDINLGANLPIDAFIGAMRQYRPRLAWLAGTHLESLTPILEGLPRLAQVAGELGTSLVLGGRSLYGQALPYLPRTHLVGSMSELAALGRWLKTQPIDAQPIMPVRPAVGNHDGHNHNSHGQAGSTSSSIHGKARPKR